ncbi:hypothetical protein HD806DRAFT_169673 [Xylariaceae sp. AK1471]|nr:hypothetical protein HD806DRAFT_169673 [Xylariaceae sp. AK1471]
MPSMQSTVLLATTLLGSLLQHAAAAPEASSKRADVQFPQCISMCVRNSGCFDNSCICEKASDGILSEIVICMNQWCSADITAKDLIGPLQGECDLPKSAVNDAEKKGGVSNTGGDDETSSAKPTATPTASGKGKDSKDDVTMTWDVGSPVSAQAQASTTVTPATPAISGTLTVDTNAATTNLLTDESAPTGTNSLVVALSTPALPSSSASANSNASSNDDKGNGAGISGHASIFGIVAAMGVALALGF